MIPRFKKSWAVIITGCVFGWVGGIYLKRQKTISLDETTAAIAERIPNFSEWVRASLLAHDEEDQNKPVLKHWLVCNLHPEAHTHMSFNYRRIWDYDGHVCVSCVKDFKLGQSMSGMGTYAAHTTIAEDEDQ